MAYLCVLRSAMPDRITKLSNPTFGLCTCLFPKSHAEKVNLRGHNVVVHGMLPGPISCDSLKLLLWRCVQQSNLWLHAHMAVRVRQQWLNADQHLKKDNIYYEQSNIFDKITFLKQAFSFSIVGKPPVPSQNKNNGFACIFHLISPQIFIQECF
jgi:hypothetical protein